MAFALIEGVIAHDAFAEPAAPSATQLIEGFAPFSAATPGESGLVDGLNQQAFAAPQAETSQPVDGPLGLSTWLAAEESVVIADLSVSDTADSLASESAVVVGISLSSTDSVDTLSSAAGVQVAVALDYVDSADTMVSAAGIVVLGGLNTTDEADTSASAVLVLIAGNLSISDSSDLLSSDASLEVLEESEVISLGGRNKLFNTPTNRVKAESSASDESDSLQAVASVTVGRSAEFSVVDHDDDLSSESFSAWAQAQLIINKARLIRAQQVRLVSSRAEEIA